MFANYSVSIIDISLSIIYGQKIVNIWNTFQTIDHEFHGFYKQDFNTTKLSLWLITIFSIVVWLLVGHSEIQAYNESFVQNFINLVNYIGSYLTVFKFCALVFLLNQRFVYLKNIVRKQIFFLLYGREKITKIKISTMNLVVKVYVNLILITRYIISKL